MQQLRDLALSAASALRDALESLDQAMDGRLWVLAVALALFLIILAVPPQRRSEAGWAVGRIASSGAIAGLAGAMLIIVVR